MEDRTSAEGEGVPENSFSSFGRRISAHSACLSGSIGSLEHAALSDSFTPPQAKQNKNKPVPAQNTRA